MINKKQESTTSRNKNFRILLSLLEYIRPYQGKFLLGLVLLFISSSLFLVFPTISGILIDVASDKEHPYFDSLEQVAIAFLVILFFQSFISFFRVTLFAQVSEKAIADIRYNLYDHLLFLTMSFYDERRTGELISRITSDIGIIQNTFSITVAELIRQMVILIFGISLIFITAPKLSLFMLILVPALIVLAMIFGRFIRKLSKKTQDLLANSNIIVEETISAIKTVKAFTNELFEIGRYRNALDKTVSFAIKTAYYRAGFIAFIIFALFGSLVAVMWYGASLVQSGELSVGELVSFILYTTFIGASLAGLGDLIGQLQKSVGATERIMEIMDEPVEQGFTDGLKKPVHLNGAIAYKNVTFSYPSRKEINILNDFHLNIKSGEKIALVGHSGSGKSTIIQLLLHYYLPNDGQIILDEHESRTIHLSALRQNIAVVPQDVVLFGGSIKENILYGKPDASQEMVIEAAKSANALEFIESFPEGFETIVGEKGIKLSGGQKQRLAIARAILKDPKILILDEATSSLDTESEKLVQDAIEKLMKNRTTIIIAHRLSTIRKVDKIYVIENGQIKEKGSHTELLNGAGTYSNLIKMQFEDSY